MATHTDFSRIFIDRPILATVLSALILVSGLMAIPSLPISEYPDVVPPSVSVTANYPAPTRAPPPTPSPDRSRKRSTASRT